MNRWKQLLIACAFGATPIVSTDARCLEKPKDSAAVQQESNKVFDEARRKEAQKLGSGNEADSASTITRPSISLELCGIEEIRVKAQDGAEAIAALRKPPGDGPFPAVVFLHGGLGRSTMTSLKQSAKTGIMHTRFLAAGYVTVTATRRKRTEQPQSPAAVWDTVSIVEHVKQLPYVDANSLTLYGGSGGGTLAMEVAGATDLAAVMAGAPATILFTGMFSKENLGEPPYSPKDAGPLMKDPQKYYTPQLQELTRKRIGKIRCPIMIAQGDRDSLKKINSEIIVPEMKAQGKSVELVWYPNQPHGFYWGRTPNQAAALQCFQDADAFFKKHIKAQPVAMDEKLFQRVSVSAKR